MLDGIVAATHRVPGTGVSVAEAWAAEKKHLLPLPPHPFPCCRYVETRAAQNQQVRCGGESGKSESRCTLLLYRGTTTGMSASLSTATRTP